MIAYRVSSKNEEGPKTYQKRDEIKMTFDSSFVYKLT